MTDADRLAEIREKHQGDGAGRGCDYCFLVNQLARLTQERDEAIQEAKMRRNDWQAVTAECDEARRSAEAARNPCNKIFSHKWLDQECVENGCQSLTPATQSSADDVERAEEIARNWCKTPDDYYECQAAIVAALSAARAGGARQMREGLDGEYAYCNTRPDQA